MKKLILDVDTGIDDAFAILYALSQYEQVELIGITTSFGNVLVQQATKNTLQVLELFEVDIPVYQGAAASWGNQTYTVPDSFERVHGRNGIGEYHLPIPRATPKELTAVDFLIEAANKHQDELIIVTLGPLTNLADALKKAPETIKKIGKIVCMAGALTIPGNITSVAEVNVYNDAAAVNYVFEHLFVTVVGLDVTLQTMITKQDIARFDRKNKKGDFLAAIAEYYYQNEYAEQDYGGALHDPLAVAIALEEGFCTSFIELNLTVEQTDQTYGRMIGKLDELTLIPKRTRFCLQIDATRFVDHFVESLAKFSGANNK